MICSDLYKGDRDLYPMIFRGSHDRLSVNYMRNHFDGDLWSNLEALSESDAHLRFSFPSSDVSTEHTETL